MRTVRGSWRPFVILAVAAAIAGCDAAEDAAGPILEGPLFSHDCSQDRWASHPHCRGGGGDEGTATVRFSGAAAGAHTGMTVKDGKWKTEIGGGGKQAIAFNFAGALARFGDGNCVARRDSGQPVDATTAAYLASFLTAEVVAGAWLEFDKREGSDGQPSSGHDLAFTFEDDQGRGTHVGIPAHGDPAPTITKVGSTYTVSGGVVRVWLRDGPPRNHPKLFCANHGDSVVATIDG
jgi:hypothetical protein